MESAQDIVEQPQRDGDTTKPSFSNKAALYHRQIPVIRKLPLPVVGIIVVVWLVNIAVWMVVGIILVIIY